MGWTVGSGLGCVVGKGVGQGVPSELLVVICHFVDTCVERAATSDGISPHNCDQSQRNKYRADASVVEITHKLTWLL